MTASTIAFVAASLMLLACSPLSAAAQQSAEHKAKHTFIDYSREGPQRNLQVMTGSVADMKQQWENAIVEDGQAYRRLLWGNRAAAPHPAKHAKPPPPPSGGQDKKPPPPKHHPAPGTYPWQQALAQAQAAAQAAVAQAQAAAAQATSQAGAAAAQAQAQAQAAAGQAQAAAGQLLQHLGR